MGGEEREGRREGSTSSGRACDLLEGCGCCSCSWVAGGAECGWFLGFALPHAKLGKRQRSRHAAPGFFIVRGRRTPCGPAGWPPNIKSTEHGRLDSTARRHGLRNLPLLVR